MGVLSGIEPIGVFRFFEEICSIPHGSGNVQQISDYLVEFAKERGLKYRQDEALNVIIWKDASEGYENSEAVIMQGHMDMVAVKTSDCDKDMTKEGLDLAIDGDYLYAKGTSLGGDDGIAVAYALAVLDDDSIAHPPIEAVFTTDEEVGLIGAAAIDASDLKGRIFMNMDSEDEGVFTVSCAGGATVSSVYSFEKEAVEGAGLKIKLFGFTGGHSGVEINKGRLNANCAMGRILLALHKNISYRLVSINGGEKDNAIANESEAVITVAPEKVGDAGDIIEQVFEEIAREHQATDANAELYVEVVEDKIFDVMDENASKAVLVMLVNAPFGVQRMNPEIEGLVQTSLNLGILKTEEAAVRFAYAVRSSNEAEKAFLIDKLRLLTELLGGEILISGDYPGWDFKPVSKLRDVMVEEYKKLYGSEPVVEGIHAGLECGLFASKISDLDAVSFGPQMHDIHTTKERLGISSTKRTWQLIVNTLAALR